MNNSINYNKKDNTYTFNCPHCSLMIQVDKNQANCLIFRHGILKNKLTQIDPHLPKKDCDYLFDQDLIYGCSKPFRLVKNSTNEISFVEICDYI